MSAGRRWLRRGLAVLASLLVALFAVEVFLRVRFAGEQRATLEDVSRSARFVPPVGREVRLGDLIRPSPRPGVVYELLPGLDTTYLGKRLTTNADGFRGPRVARAKPAGTVRILGLGDSVQFGWGVHDGEPYLERLRGLLSERYPDVTWETVNTAVPGYNTAMEVATLETRGLDLDPDLVLVGFVRNDLFLPNFLLTRRDPWSPARSFLLDLVAEGLDPGSRLVKRPAKGNDPDSELVPEVYRSSIGVAGYRAAMERLVELQARHGFRLVVFCEDEHETNAEVRAIREELGVPLVSSAEHVTDRMSELGITEKLGSALTVGATDPHPSALGHELIAEALALELERLGVLEALIARTKR